MQWKMFPVFPTLAMTARKFEDTSCRHKRYCHTHNLCSSAFSFLKDSFVTLLIHFQLLAVSPHDHYIPSINISTICLAQTYMASLFC